MLTFSSRGDSQMSQFSKEEMSRIGTIAMDIRAVMHLAGITGSDLELIAAFKLLARTTEIVSSMPPEEQKRKIQEVETGSNEDPLNLREELTFILSQMDC